MKPAATNHNAAVEQIAEELGLKKEDVDRTIDVFFSSLKQQMKYPYVISIPKIGELKPDMRVYRGIVKRQELLKLKVKPARKTK